MLAHLSYKIKPLLWICPSVAFGISQLAQNKEFLDWHNEIAVSRPVDEIWYCGALRWYFNRVYLIIETTAFNAFWENKDFKDVYFIQDWLFCRFEEHYLKWHLTKINRSDVSVNRDQKSKETVESFISQLPI